MQGPGAKRLRMPKAGKAIPHIRGFRSVAGALQSPRVSVLEQSLLWVLFSDVPRGRLALVEGGQRPGTRSPGRGMEAAAAAADVIWSWAEQVMEKGSMTPKVGSPRKGS